MGASYYYRRGAKVAVQIAETARVVRETGERAELSRSRLQSRPLSSRLRLVYPLALAEERQVAPSVGSPSATVLAAEKAWRQDARRVDSEGERSVAQRLEGAPLVVGFPVVLGDGDDSVLFSTGDVVAQFSAAMDRPRLSALCSEKGWRIDRTLRFLPNAYVLSSETSPDPLGLANLLVEEHGAVFAHPVFLEETPDRSGEMTETAIDTPKPCAPGRLAGGDEGERDVLGTQFPVEAAKLFGQQWHLHNTGQNGSLPGVDIAALAAWAITTGDPAIAVAVIDSGLSSSHEAFLPRGKLLAGYDFDEADALPEPTTSSHGTSCSALVAAGIEGGNVLGVAPRCSIIPMRRSVLTNHVALGEALVWAADHGADILSCSFGVDGRPWILPDVVRAAMEYVTTHGRQGRGCPIFWAAGNGGELVSPDEWASSDYVIAVAASTDQERRAFYSDFGPEVDVCAPSSGGSNGIATAVNEGYTTQFGGTSAAAPIAAGVAALALSIAPHLRWDEVRSLLASTARKIDPEGGQYDAAGHSIYYGYGQVDAYRTLVSVDALTEVMRATGTESQGPNIDAFRRYLERSSAGSVILGYIGQKRLAILRRLLEASSFRQSLAHLMMLVATVGYRLQTGEAIQIPESSWPAIEEVARTVVTLQRDA